MRNRRRKNNKSKIIIPIIIVIILVVLGLSFWLWMKNSNETKTKEKNDKELVSLIESHYNNYVITNKETSLYDSKGKEIGKINKDIYLELEDINIDKNTKYFKISNLDNYYIKYEDVDKSEKKRKK